MFLFFRIKILSITIPNRIRLDLFLYFLKLITNICKDKTHDQIAVDHLDEFLNISEKDKRLLPTTSKRNLKSRASIKDNRNSIFEINVKLLMALLIDQIL